MAKEAYPAVLVLGAALLLSGCTDLGAGTKYPDADSQTSHRISGEHSDHWCAPEPINDGDNATISMFVDFEGSGTITMTGWDGPSKTVDVESEPQVDEDAWHRGWNTGEICFDINLDGKGEYAIGVYLD